MPKFREKPVVIEAYLWFENGDHPEDHEPFGDGPHSAVADEKYYEYMQTEGKVVRYFRHPTVPGEQVCDHCGSTMHDHGWIDTLEGGHVVCPGDWIITGVRGERYPRKPDIFEQTYDIVPEEGETDACPKHPMRKAETLIDQLYEGVVQLHRRLIEEYKLAQRSGVASEGETDV